LVNLQHLYKKNLEDNINKNIIIKFCLILFDENTIYFLYYDKKANDLKIVLMKDLKEPFCPIPCFLLFNYLHKLNDFQFYDLLNEKLEKFIEYKSINNDHNNKITGSAFNASIYVTINTLEYLDNKGYYHLHIFSANKNSEEIKENVKINESENDYLKLYSTQNEIKLFISDKNISEKFQEILLKNKITLNIFYLGYSNSNKLEPQLHLPTFFDLSTKSGGRGFYYSLINNKDNQKENINNNNYIKNINNNNNNINNNAIFADHLKNHLEKLHYDINSILQRKYFYNLDILIKHSKTFTVLETYFGMKNTNNKIILPSISNDFNISILLNFSKILQEDKSSNFQFIVRYNDIYDNNYRKMRIFNSAIFSNENYYKIYTSIDVDVMSRMIFFKETSDLLIEKNKNSNCFIKAKENIKKRVTDSLYFYKKQVFKYLFFLKFFLIFYFLFIYLYY
jgi:hypothetical protein